MTRLILRLCLLVFLTGVVLAAPPKKAILLVWDAKNDRALEDYPILIKTLKDMRAAGDFRVDGLHDKFLSYDYNQANHRQALKDLGIRREQCVYLAVVQIDPQKLPRKVLWGQKVSNVPMAAMELKTHVRGGLAVASRPLISGIPAQGGPPTETVSPTSAPFLRDSRSDKMPDWNTYTSPDGTFQALIPSGSYQIRQAGTLFEFYCPGSCAVGYFEAKGDNSNKANIITISGDLLGSSRVTEVKQVWKGKLGGYPAADFLLVSSTNIAFRAVDAGDRVYFAALSQSHPMDKFNSFFNSFVVRYH